MARTALYTGSFDPVTLGHVDVVRHACRLVDRLVIAIGVHPGKAPMFSAEERAALLREVCGPLAAGPFLRSASQDRSSSTTGRRVTGPSMKASLQPTATAVTGGQRRHPGDRSGGVPSVTGRSGVASGAEARVSTGDHHGCGHTPPVRPWTQSGHQRRARHHPQVAFAQAGRESLGEVGRGALDPRVPESLQHVEGRERPGELMGGREPEIEATGIAVQFEIEGASRVRECAVARRS